MLGIIESVIISFFDYFLLTGFVFILGGVALLLSNIFIARAIKKDKEKLLCQAVTDNE